MHGRGTFKWSNDRTYAGQYKNSKKDGYGELTWPDGRYYKGDWKQGKQHGKGCFRSKEGHLKYGEWINGKRQKWYGVDAAETSSNGEDLDLGEHV